jgi:hypothetical protein
VAAQPPSNDYEPAASPAEIARIIDEPPPAEFTQPKIPAPPNSPFEEGVLQQYDIMALLQRIA